MNEREDEYLKRRKRARRRRQKQLRRRLAAACIILAVLVVIIIVAVTVNHRKKADQTKEVPAISVSAQSTAAEGADSTVDAGLNDETLVSSEGADVSAAPSAEGSENADAAENTAVPEQTTEETAAQDGAQPGIVQSAVYEPDRSNFAVDPNIPCGSDTDNGQKVVYLTLDDGPSELTPQVLDILDRYNIKITFFVTAENPEYSYLIKEAYDRGHTIGLHTYSHDYEYIYSSTDNYFQDLDAIGQVVAGQIGYVPCFIRFPGGSANYISHDYCEGIMSALAPAVQERGYQYFDWNASSGDGGPCTDPNELAAAACSFDYYENVVLLSHDGSGHEATVQALPIIIEHYLSLGYEFRPLDRSSYHSHQTIYN